jgi:hypothetical protein
MVMDVLNPTDMVRLTRFKWRYEAVEARGFSDAEATLLMYLKWLKARGRIGGKDDGAWAR